MSTGPYEQAVFAGLAARPAGEFQALSHALQDCFQGMFGSPRPRCEDAETEARWRALHAAGLITWHRVQGSYRAMPLDVIWSEYDVTEHGLAVYYDNIRWRAELAAARLADRRT